MGTKREGEIREQGLWKAKWSGIVSTQWLAATESSPLGKDAIAL